MSQPLIGPSYALSFGVCVFCLQLCVNRGVIRSMAPARYPENASESENFHLDLVEVAVVVVVVGGDTCTNVRYTELYSQI